MQHLLSVIFEIFQNLPIQICNSLIYCLKAIFA